MAKQEEAKVRFKLESAEFTKGINDIKSSMSVLNKELKLVETQMKANGESVESYEKKQGILEKQLSNRAKQIELLKQKMEVAKNTVGENSKEYQSLSKQLLDAETKHVKLQQAVDKNKTAMNNHIQAINSSETALGKLKSTISSQEDELNKLVKEYQNALI